jgi:hypothetical protein
MQTISDDLKHLEHATSNVLELLFPTDVISVCDADASSVYFLTGHIYACANSNGRV